MIVSKLSASLSAPVPLAIARSMLSLGIEASLAFWTASARRGLPSISPPPSLAAMVMARASFVNSFPRRASTIAFLCLMPAHLECPAMAPDSTPRRSGLELARAPHARAVQAVARGGREGFDAVDRRDLEADGGGVVEIDRAAGHLVD